MSMGWHNLNISSLMDRNLVFMLLIATHSVGAMAMAIMEAKEEAEGDVVDVAMLKIPPPLTALMFQTSTGLLHNRNGTCLVLDVLLYFS